MKFKNLNKNKKAVSEVLGSMLLVSISVTLFSGAYLTFFSTDVEDVPPHVDIMASIKDNKLIFEHRGGDDITSRAYAVLTNESNNSTSIVIGDGDYLEDANNNNRWDIGENVVLFLDELKVPFYFDFEDDETLSIMLVDPVSHSTLLTGILAVGGS